MLGGSVHTVQKNREALVAAGKETGLEVNADKTKYMVMSWDQNAERSNSVKIDDSSFERAEQFKWLGILTHQNYIQEEIERRLKSGNVCYLSVQNLLSSKFLSKNTKITMHINYYFACCFVWVWNLAALIEGGT